jgi:hypothetical protein
MAIEVIVDGLPDDDAQVVEFPAAGASSARNVESGDG